MSQLSRFFYNGSLHENDTVSLDPDTAKHIWQVLRMDAGDMVLLTDGKGTAAQGIIQISERHKCNVSLGQVTFHRRQGQALHLCVGFTKNNSRNEWLLEKATELGVCSIVPIEAARSEKTHVRTDRWEKILQSSILQSQQNYLPYLAEITPLKNVLEKYSHIPQKLVAHCMASAGKRPITEMLNPATETVILIGPEGDFTQDEVNLCIESGYGQVSLGTQRLRTETAAIAVAAYCNLIYDGKN